MKVKMSYKGPATHPTEASIALTFAKESLEVAPAFKATWRDPAQPPSPGNRTGIEAGLSVSRIARRDLARGREGSRMRSVGRRSSFNLAVRREAARRHHEHRLGSLTIASRVDEEPPLTSSLRRSIDGTVGHRQRSSSASPIRRPRSTR
jgi:hypothetical protein